MLRSGAATLLVLSLICATAVAEPVEALLNRAEALYTRKDYRAGLRISLGIIDRTDAEPKQRARASLYVGVFYTELGRHPQAVNAFLEVLRYMPAFRLPPAAQGTAPSYPRVKHNFRAALTAFSAKKSPPARTSWSRRTAVVAAMFSIDMQGVPHARQLRPRLEKYLYAQLAAQGGFQLVATKRLASALRTQRKESYRPCYAQSCQVAIGEQLAARAAINTMLFRIGSRCLGTITLYDLKSGTTQRAATAEGGCSAEQLLDIVKRLAGGLGG